MRRRRLMWRVIFLAAALSLAANAAIAIYAQSAISREIERMSKDALPDSSWHRAASRAAGKRIATAEALASAFLAAAIYFVVRRELAPLEEIKAGAARFREGDFSWRLKESGPEEIASIARTMNEMASDLAARIEKLKELERIRRDFVANVSHELKTPLASMQGFAEALSEHAMDDPERARRFASIVAAQAARLSSIVEDLLELSRVEQLKEAPSHTLERQLIAPILERVIALCEERAAEREMRIDVSCPQDLAAPVNAALLERAVENLLDNAIKHGAEGQTISVGARAADGEIEISVADQGPGIPPEHLPRVFERFYRVDEGRSRKTGGTGLGLSIVKHIAELHGGKVSAENRPQGGCAFTIRIPA